jgi:hypothetical protein
MGKKKKQTEEAAKQEEVQKNAEEAQEVAEKLGLNPNPELPTQDRKAEEADRKKRRERYQHLIKSGKGIQVV